MDEKDLHNPGVSCGCTLSQHVNIFYRGLTTNTQSYTKCTYIIDQEHNHVVLPDHTSICLVWTPDHRKSLGLGH